MAASEVQAAVKWGSKSFSVQIDLNEPLEVFQAQLYTLTGVPVERQKLLCKGKTIKVDADLRAVATSGCPKIMLMGTAEEAAKVQPPVGKTVFVEDLTPAQQAALLREKKVEPLPNHGTLKLLALALKDFYNQWEQTIEPVSPFLLVGESPGVGACPSRGLSSVLETFNISSRHNWDPDAAGRGGVCLMSAVSESLDRGAAEGLSKSLAYVPLTGGSSALDLLFGVQVEVTSSRNKTDGEEKPSANVQIERHRKLTCFLGTPQKPVSTLEDSLRFSLGDEVVQVGKSGNTAATAAAPAAGEAAAAEETLIRTNRIKSLALYLILHFMRFEWKVGGTESEKAKICRSVKFGQTLDMYPFCTKELQESFKVGRAIVALRREREASTNVPASGTPAAGAAAAAAAANGSSNGATDASAEPAAEQAEANTNGNAEAAKREAELLLLAGKPCPTGTYELVSVVTHQGRYADSGHYVGWARAGKGEAKQEPSGSGSEETKKEEEQQEAPSGPAAKKQKNVVMWRKFDDDKVTEVPWESIDLAGGRSDYHVAYLLLMKHVLIVPSEEELKILAKQM
ncbi:ubiquitin carboxyl-terminal hydrolase, putative [Eimeria praecox]|uniref:ubiquitinyl hydrolase 1 n=1 Tax=Eimeria praecox TaxID=51316 RepID=U6GZV9_9EIME|nr:ubiquitin carboxyl-terminal hydrolase, putative [Eimeria praecox]